MVVAANSAIGWLAGGVPSPSPPGRRHAVKRVLPFGGGARDQRHAVADRDHIGGADPKRRMTYLETVRRNIQSRDCDAFSRCAGVEPNPRPAGEWLDRQVAERKAVADLAENPSGAAVIACGRAIEEAGAREGAVGVDRIERVSDAPATSQLP